MGEMTPSDRNVLYPIVRRKYFKVFSANRKARSMLFKVSMMSAGLVSIGLMIVTCAANAQVGQREGDAAKLREPAPTEEKDSSGERADPAAEHVQTDEIKEFRKTAIQIKFPSQGLTLYGWMYRPPGEGPFPAIVWNHGSEKSPGAHPELGKFYTDHGYVLFLPVRHGHGRSPGQYIGNALDDYKELVTDKKLIQKKAVDLQDAYNADVVAAVVWLRHQPYIDGEKIAVSGVSYGGIQTLLAAEKGLDCKAFIPFAPGAMSWANTQLQKREAEAVRRAHAPLFLIQAKNDYSIGPSEVLGPIVKEKGGQNRAKLYPAFGTTPQDGHAGFACWEEGIAIWGPDVLEFLRAAGMPGESHEQKPK